MHFPTRLRYMALLFFCSCIAVVSCKKKNDITPPPAPSSDKIITAFNFTTADNPVYVIADIIGTVGSDSVKLTVPAETNISNLKPAINFKGKSISPANGVAQNFSAPLNYTVTAEDGSTKKYIVTVSYKSTVYISDLGGTLYALDAITGQDIWKLNNGKFHSGSPSVSNGTIYICGIDGMYAVDARSGLQKWKYPITATPTFPVFAPSAVIINNIVYFSAWDGFVYALNGLDGSVKWKTPSTTGKAFYSNVTVNNNLLYTGCADSSLYAIDIANGNISWKFTVADVIYKNPLIVNNNVFIGALNGSTKYLLNGTTGAIIWSIPNDDLTSSATLDNGIIYCGGGARAFGFNAATGASVWYIQVSGSLQNERSSGIANNGIFYAGSNNGGIYAWDINSKTVLWSLPNVGNAYVWASPVIANGLVYIGGTGGDLFALDKLTGIQKWKRPLSSIIGSTCVIDENGIKYYPGLSGEKN